jgi:hypothetical protein
LSGSDRIELAKIELEIAEDLEVVTATEVIRWLRNRPRTESTIAWIERAAAAVGRAKRLRSKLR